MRAGSVINLNNINMPMCMSSKFFAFANMTEQGNVDMCFSIGYKYCAAINDRRDDVSDKQSVLWFLPCSAGCGCKAADDVRGLKIIRLVIHTNPPGRKFQKPNKSELILNTHISVVIYNQKPADPVSEAIQVLVYPRNQASLSVIWGFDLGGITQGHI